MKGFSENKDNLYIIWLYLCEAYARVLNAKLKEVKGDFEQFIEKSQEQINSFRTQLQNAIDFFDGLYFFIYLI